MIDENIEQNTREAIKSRMLRLASRLWGYAGTVSENDFDPIVGLLLEALAAEIEQVYTEVKVSEARSVERLAQNLLPDIVTSAKPSHTIIHALPAEDRFTMRKTQHLYYKKTLPTLSAAGRDLSKNIFFTPLYDTVLVKGAVKVLATPFQLFKVNNALDKEPVASGNLRNTENNALSLWIGIDISPSLKNLKGVSFFFENKNDVERERFYNLFGMCEASCAGRPFHLRQGFYPPGIDEKNGVNALTDITAKIENTVAGIYAPCFLHIADDFAFSESDFVNYPKELENFYSGSQLAYFKNKMLWIKLSGFAGLTNKVLPDILVSLNCFPVVNRQMLEFSYRLQEGLNIIPLATDDVYLDILKIYSSSQLVYRPLQKGSGSYTIRHGAVGRFDSRSAAELLEHLISVLRDESASFSAMGMETLQSNIRQLNQLINAMQQRLRLTDKRKDTATYLVIQPDRGHENIYVEYWVTQGFYASGIRQGTALQLYSGSGLVSGSIYSLRNTSAAQEKLSANESINAFKSALISRGRIVTTQDIRYACFAELGSLLQEVKIKTSYLKPLDGSSGFQKAIMVELVPVEGNTEVDWDYECRRLLLKIEQESLLIVPVKVTVKK